MDSRATRVCAVLVVSLALGGCRHAPRPVASSGTPTPSPSVTTPTPTPTPTRTTHPSPRPSSSTTPPGPARACKTNEISVSIRTDKASYPAGDEVVFAITARNIGTVRCRVNVEGLYVTITDPSGRPIQMPQAPGVPVFSPSGSPSSSASPSPAGQPHDPEPYYAHDLRPGEKFTEGCDWQGSVADPAKGPYASKKPEPGTYHATAHWQYPLVTSAPVAFRLT